MITIVDYKMGNIGSILNMLKRLGVKATISSDPAEVEAAEKLILPGVGSFDRGMANMEELGLLPVLNRLVIEEGTPVLGICLGMQLLMDGSEEGVRPGLAWLHGRTILFRRERLTETVKVPHMGWNTVAPTERETLFSGLDEDHGFYFVHSYHVECADSSDVLATTTHGYAFASAVRRGNIFGTQFHPEKSHRFGLRLLKNFVERV